MKPFLTIAVCLLACPAGAGGLAGAQVSIPLPPGPEVSILTATYRCGAGKPFPVQYVNAGDNSLAILTVEGGERIFVNVVAGSGARYVSGAYEWWTKGSDATLRDLQKDDSGQDCTRTDDSGTVP